MAKWTAFPHAGDYALNAASLKKNWARLHQGDCEPLPQEADVLEAWVLFHNGEFLKAAEAGVKAGGHGLTVANKATSIYANYLETKEKTKLELFMEVAARAEAHQAAVPKNPNAWYWQAYALGRYSQGISVAKALAQGLGSKVKHALEQAIKLQPKHADAHIALAAFHAEVIDKVGSLIGGMTYGAKKDVGLALYKDALKLNPRLEEFQPYFESVRVLSFTQDGAPFYAVEGTGFNYQAYREGVLGTIFKRYYNIPSALPMTGCPFCERYCGQVRCPR